MVLHHTSRAPGGLAQLSNSDAESRASSERCQALALKQTKKPLLDSQERDVRVRQRLSLGSGSDFSATTPSVEESSIRQTSGRSPDLAPQPFNKRCISAQPSHLKQWPFKKERRLGEHHSGGTVRDLHPLPYSPAAIKQQAPEVNLKRTDQAAGNYHAIVLVVKSRCHKLRTSAAKWLEQK